MYSSNHEESPSSTFSHSDLKNVRKGTDEIQIIVLKIGLF